MHETAISDGRQQKWKGKVEAQHARAQLTICMSYCVTGTERNVLERPAILPERYLSLGAAVEVVEDGPRQSSTREGPKVIDTNDAGRRYCTRCCRHRRSQ
jgi:hypothetical protein